MNAKNIGRTDRIIRILVSLGLIALVFIGPKTSWGWIGLVPLLTALVGTCPLYSIFGIKS